MSHTITIVAGVAAFACTEDLDTECHKYPDCQCEDYSDGHENHPPVWHPTCNLAGWFGHTDDIEAMYTEDAGEMPADASGEISIEWDECPLWSYVVWSYALPAVTE